MSKITTKCTPKFPHFRKKKRVKRKQKYFLIVSRTILKNGSELKSNCVLMKSISKHKLKALKLIEISRNLLKKYSKQSFLYPTNKKMKYHWELEIPLALQKPVTKIMNDKARKVVINNKTIPDNIDDGEEIQECDEDSVDTDNMIIHVSSSSSECSSPKIFKDGDQNYNEFSRYESHLNYDDDNMLLECQYCTKTFKQQRTLDEHIAKQNEFSCTQCDKLLKCKNSLMEHLKIHDVSKNLHQCFECNKTFSNSEQLSLHKETHLIGLLKNKNPLNNRQIVHSNKLMYSCDICNLSFKYLNSLTSHKNIHQTLADNRCGICGVSFTDRKLYLRHSFEHADEPFVECDICSKRFFKENHLSEHIKSHMTSYVDCDLCKKTIKKGQLKQHIDHVHSEDQRQFVCTHCNKAFTRSKTLKYHMQTHMQHLQFG